MDVHRDIDRSERGAEREQRDGQRQRRRCDRQCRQDNGKPEPACQDDWFAAEARAQRTGQQHGNDGTDADAQKKQAERSVIDRQSLLGEWHKRCPTSDAETRHEKREARSKSRRWTVGGQRPISKLHLTGAGCQLGHAEVMTSIPGAAIELKSE